MRNVLVLVLSLLLLGAAAPAALADGDPASDYLLGQSTFIPPDAHISAADQAKLVAMLASAKKQGFPLKLAVITSRYDLGAVPILFNMPQRYARFLSEEDYYYWRSELLVLMPNGYAVYKVRNLPAADRAVLKTLPKINVKDGASLGAAAQAAVAALAAKHGLTLSTSTSSSSGTSPWVERGEILAGALIIFSLAFAAYKLWQGRRRETVRT
jgi:hypothetical protein